ncbi:Yip1 domain protein [uncultured archaeon]|nr:Yip1 domain protein [uncultured archaeon]
MNFVEKFVETIKNPKNAMKSIAEQPMIEEAVAIVGIYAILSALVGYVQSYKVTYIYEGFENMPSSLPSMMAIFAVVGGLVGAFIVWLVGAGIIHLISMALGGEGKLYPQMMTVVGYSMVPMIFAGIISLVMLFMLEPMTITISRTNPMAVKELYNNPYILASSIIGLIMQIWFSIILFFGIQSAHKLTPAKSAIAAGIPLAVIVISFIFSIWIRSIS